MSIFLSISIEKGYLHLCDYLWNKAQYPIQIFVFWNVD